MSDADEMASSATLRERPPGFPRPSGLSVDEEQSADISALRSELKAEEIDHAELERRIVRFEAVLELHKRAFALASGLDPDLSLEVIEALLKKINEDSGGKGAPNEGADALSGLLRGKLGGEKTGGAALLTLLAYIVAKLMGAPVP